MSKLLFVAFPIPEKWRTVFAEYSESFGHNEFLRFTPKENFHMTLVFLGAVDEDAIPEITDALSEIASIQQPFALELNGVEYGPEGKTPTMIWARFKDNINFGILSGRVVEELSYIIGKIDALTPMPHITLARFNKDVEKPKVLMDLKNTGHERTSMEVSQMCLMESKSTASGSVYNVLATFDFLQTEGVPEIE